MLKKGEHAKFKNLERKIKSPFMIYADFLIPEVFSYQKSFIRTNMKNMLLAVMAIN